MKLQFNPTTHQYRLNGVVIPSVTQILANTFTTVFYSETSAEMGTEIHKDCENFDMGIRIESAFKHPKRVAQYSLALQDIGWGTLEKLAFSPSEIEVASYHPDFFYAGTTDRKRERMFSLDVMDIKSGALNKPRDILQLHAYANMILANLTPIRRLMIGERVTLYNFYVWDDDYDIRRYQYRPEIFDTFVALKVQMDLKDNNNSILKYYKGEL